MKFRGGPHLPLPRHCLGPQDPRGPPANCGTHRVNSRYMIRSINIRQNFTSCSSFMILSYINLIRLHVENAKVFQRISMNLNMTVGQAVCQPREWEGGEQGGLGHPWILKILAKEGCFLDFEWEKKFHHFWLLPRKIWKNPRVLPPLEKILPTPMMPTIVLSNSSTLAASCVW